MLMTSSTPAGCEEPASAPLRVLVIDDLVDAAVTMARLLQLLACDVQTAHDGPAALRIAAEFSPQLVFLDLGLPGLDGYEVARRLRSHSATAESLIIALSGYGHFAARDAALAAGCDEHWLKPATVEQLTALIEGRRRSH